MKRISYFLILVLISSCLPTLKFESIPCEKFRDCKETIKKVYLLQEPDKAPVSIVVTDEYIAWSKDAAVYHKVTGATTRQNQQNTIYFKDIEDLRVVYDTYYKIRFINKANKTSHAIVIADKDYAIQGCSAIKCMIELSKSNSDGLY